MRACRTSSFLFNVMLVNTVVPFLSNDFITYSLFTFNFSGSNV